MSGTVQDQSAVVEYLASPPTHGGGRVERIDTHAAYVFLTGARAYKLKRAVRYDYLDFSTADLRRAACEAECRLNRRTAPSLYRRVLPITRGADGALALDGDGPAVDWVLEMTRFPQEALLDRLAAAGRLDIAVMPALASAIATFHREAAIRRDHGGREGMAWVVEGNAEGFDEFGGDVFAPDHVAQVMTATRAALDRHGDTLDARRDAGLVRHCHGDLHLRNLVLLDGAPTLFDGVEFNDRIACIDVLYDLAFLLMDLHHRGLRAHANVLCNRYLADTERLDGLALLPLFLACRAAVRAKTSATAARLQDAADARAGLHRRARAYLGLAAALIAPPRACLVAIGGLSGTGKSTVARAIAPDVGPAPGAVVLRSDERRKRMLGVSMDEPLPPDAYTLEASRRVYESLARDARSVLREGHAVVVDAVHQREEDREVLENEAAAAGVPFVGLWLEAPDDLLVARVSGRTGDASDADADVVRRQAARDSGRITWTRVDARDDADAVVARVRAMLPATVRGE